MKFIERIQPGNSALLFIDRRISDDKYRGGKSSEHNRYDMKEIHTILKLLKKYGADSELLQIRNTDLSKRPENTDDEIPYAKFCGEVKDTVGKGTQDSIRKNIFVDMHRMGLIYRYNKKKKRVLVDKRSSVKYVSLTEDGVKFAYTTELLNQRFMFSKSLDKLLGGYLEISLELLSDEDYAINSISKYEFMFFVSAIDCGTSFSVTKDECVKLLKSYKSLAPTQRRAVIEKLKGELDPDKFSGVKTNKRDWHNWQNKIDQIYYLFGQTVYFEVNSDKLTLSSKQIKTADGEVLEVKKRSARTKSDYYKNHKVGKSLLFDLHHVLPLSWAESPEQYKLFDNWENLVYIDVSSHAKITRNRNCNIVMRGEGSDIELSDYSGNAVYLAYQTNISYSLDLQKAMLDYNERLRNTDTK